LHGPSIFVQLKYKQIWKLYMDDSSLSVNRFKSIEYNSIDFVKFITGLVILLSCSHVFATGQRSDEFYFQNRSYSLIGLKGKLITPMQFGMETVPSNTSNWRGYFSVYTIVDGQLLLSKITINAKNEKYLPINGIEPDLEATKSCFLRGNEEICSSDGGVYIDVDFPVPLNGKIRLGSGFIRGLYVHMGFQKPSAFKEVVDLEFKSGKLIKIIDRSKDAALIRGRFQKEYYDDEAENAVQSSFSLEMDELK